MAFGVAALAWLVIWTPPTQMPALPAPESFEIGRDVEAYLAAVEGEVPNVLAGAEKRVVWAGAAGSRTEWSVVYLHGFSATSEEIRPVPERVAEALGANLFYTRFTGHGRDGPAMAEASSGAWGADTSEALAIGEHIGERTLVIATSTGGTLAAIAAADQSAAPRIDAEVLISPNFGPQNPAAFLLTWPLAETWVPWIAGKTRSFEPENEAHARWWTESYPTIAAIPMQAAVERANAVNLSQASAPALVIYSPGDEVVRPEATKEAMERWGGPVSWMEVPPERVGDPSNHVLAGDILSPDMTGPVIERILEWMATVE